MTAPGKLIFVLQNVYAETAVKGRFGKAELRKTSPVNGLTGLEPMLAFLK